MDVEQLHVVLQQSFSADATIRKPAEQTIRNLKHIPGATQLLLQVAAEPQVRFEVRQAAAIQLKNICREGWAERATGILPPSPSSGANPQQQPSPLPSSSSSSPSLLSDADKLAVKHGIIPALLAEHEKSLRDLMAETVHTIVIHDFPDLWPQLVPILLTAIQNGVASIVVAGGVQHQPQQQQPQQQQPHHALQVHNALLALRKVCKRYEYKSKDLRGPLNDIVKAAFPLLLPLGQQLSSEHSHSLEAAMMLKQILKIFWSSTQFYLPGDNQSPTDHDHHDDDAILINNQNHDQSSGITNSKKNMNNNNNNGGATKLTATSSTVGLTRPEQLQPWFDILTACVKKPLPEASTGLEPHGQPIDIDARNSWPWWKAKKWAVQIMSRLFSRYGIPSYADDDIAKEFAIQFSQTVAPQFLGPVCETLNLRPSGQFCTDRVVHLCLTFVDLAVELSTTYRLLKPHLDFLLYQVCFPTMCLRQDDIDCFENDPVEFVHKQNSPLADFFDPRMSAITLVTDLVKHRGQDVTNNLLGRMTEILHRYATAPMEQRNHIEKDGALLMFGSLSKFLLDKKKYATEIEGLLVTSVFPDFNSPVAFLRYRACWMVQQFSTVKWSDDGTNLRTLLEMVLNRLSDPALPVQIEASKALRFLIEVDGAEHTLLPVLPQLLNEYFRIMNEIGNDEVVSALQVLLDKFGDHIEPHAVQLVTQLAAAFHQYSSAGEGEEDDDAALAAAQCLECIATVLKGVCGKESILRALEPLIMPLVLKILGNDGDFIEYLESALDILTFLTYFQSRLTADVWQAFPLIYVAFDQWAYDYLNLMVPCLQSYIHKAPEVFLAGTTTLQEGTVTYLDLMVSIVAKTVTNDRATESECRYALSLFMSILHNCPGKVDSYLPYMNDIVLGKLGQQVNDEIPLTRISIYQVIGSALYYNPMAELLELEKRGVTQQVFTKWLCDAVGMEKFLPKKLTVLGLSAIFAVPVTSLPPSIAGALPQLIHAAVSMSLSIKEDAQKEETGGTNDGLDEDGGLGGDNSGDIGVDLDNGFEEHEDVTNEVDEAYRKALQGVSNWDDDMAKFLLGDFEEENEGVDEDYSSPLDQVDELIYLSDALKHAFAREPDAYQRIQAALPPDTVTACQRLFGAADAMRAQAAQQASQQS